MAALFNSVAMPKDNTICDAQFRLVPAQVNYLGQIEKMSAALAAFDPDTFETTITDLVDAALAGLQNRAYAEYALNVNLSGGIPSDDTVPQITEGDEILSVSITPTSATARIRVQFAGTGASNTAAGMTAALFLNGAANAIAMTFVDNGTTAVPQQLALDYEYVPGTATAQVLSIRVGGNLAATVRMNGLTTARSGGGAQKSTLIASQITA